MSTRHSHSPACVGLVQQNGKYCEVWTDESIRPLRTPYRWLPVWLLAWDHKGVRLRFKR